MTAFVTFTVTFVTARASSLSHSTSGCNCIYTTALGHFPASLVATATLSDQYYFTVIPKALNSFSNDDTASACLCSTATSKSPQSNELRPSHASCRVTDDLIRKFNISARVIARTSLSPLISRAGLLICALPSQRGTPCGIRRRLTKLKSQEMCVSSCMMISCGCRA